MRNLAFIIICLIIWSCRTETGKEKEKEIDIITLNREDLNGTWQLIHNSKASEKQINPKTTITEFEILNDSLVSAVVGNKKRQGECKISYKKKVENEKIEISIISDIMIKLDKNTDHIIILGLKAIEKNNTIHLKGNKKYYKKV